jgi:phage/plasmid-like protein (TIGR03299 family)
VAHEIASTNGRPTVAYFGDKPWHGLGTELDEPATAADAITAAGLNYEVGLAPLMTADGTPVVQRKAVVRGDSKQVLGVVGNSYIPIQNSEAFQFLDTVVADGGLRYHTAGALGKGERIWLLAKLPGYLRVNCSDDITEKFLLLSNSHNGSSALRVFFTPIRVVCANTLSVAHRGGEKQGVSILHKGDLGAKVREAQKVLGLAYRFYDDVQLKVDRLARHFPTSAQLKEFFETLYPDPAVADKSRAENTRRQLFTLFESGKGQDLFAIRHSTWAAVNAVTEYVDHHRPTRARTIEERTSRRLQSQWFSSGAQLKAKAWSLALQIADSN